MNRELMTACTTMMLIIALALPIVAVPVHAEPLEVYVVAADPSGNSNYILSLGDGTFGSQEYVGQVPQAIATYGCGIGDFDNDGAFDYVIGSGVNEFPPFPTEENYVYLYEKLGFGNTFAQPVPVGIWTEGMFAMDFAVADYNKDGKLDFILTHYGSANSELYLGDGDLTFTHTVLTNTQPFEGIGADSADFNNDGNPDFAVAQYNGTTPYYIYVNLGHGDGTFTTTSFEASSDAWGLTAADFDKYGNVDIISGGVYTNGWYFYKGKGDGTFESGVLLSGLPSKTSPIDNYDFNDDGNQDLIIGYGLSALYYSGDGVGTFNYGTEITGGSGYERYAISAPPTETVPIVPGPRARFTWYPKRPLVNEPVTFDASLSKPDCNGAPIVSYAWDFETDGKIDAYGVIPLPHPFSADGIYLVTLNVTDSQGFWDTKTYAIKVGLEPAIRDGVAWLAAQQNTDGSWGWDYAVAKTAFAVLKLEEHAIDWKYGYGLPSPFDPRYPYRERVEKGLNYIFAHAYVKNIGVQPAGNPDTNGNGEGVYFMTAAWDVQHRTYETSVVMMAIAGSRAPDRVVSVSGSQIDGWKYKTVLQDLVDYFAWSQADVGTSRGGWGYSECDSGTWLIWWDRSDQSTSGWATFGLGFAESPAYKFECIIPAFVKTELNTWIDYIQNDVDGDINDGGAGYFDPSWGANILKTGHLLYMMAFVGDTAETPRVQDAVAYLVRHWNDPNDDPGWRRNPWAPWMWGSNYQATLNVMKGLFTLGIHKIDGIDWQLDFEHVLLAEQLDDGSWPYTTWGDNILGTVWALLTLEKVAPPPITKVLSPTEGKLGDVAHVTLNVRVAAGETATVVDTLPPELKYLTGTFKVNGVSATPTVGNEVISYTLTAAGAYKIEFDARVTKAYWEDRTVTNKATATWYDELGNMVEQVETTADFVIHAFEQLHKTVTGSLTIKEKTNVQWPVTFEVTNPFSYTMTNVVITDRFSAEIEIDKKFPYSITKGKASYTLYGTSEQVHLTWNIGNLRPGETAKLTILVSTNINPAGKQEYTKPGIYTLNSGATLKFIDPEQNMQLSAVTAPIYVTVLPA